MVRVSLRIIESGNILPSFNNITWRNRENTIECENPSRAVQYACTPGRIGPPIGPPPSSITSYYHDWLDKDGYPFWPFWENIRSWWAIRYLPNVYLLHFANLKHDLAAEIRGLAEFIETPIDEAKWDSILRHCSFEYMKANATKSVPLGGVFWDGGAQTFIHKGTNGRWRNILSSEEISKYERRAAEELDSECAQWLATGTTISKLTNSIHSE